MIHKIATSYATDVQVEPYIELTYALDESSDDDDYLTDYLQC